MFLTPLVIRMSFSDLFPGFSGEYTVKEGRMRHVLGEGSFYFANSVFSNLFSNSDGGAICFSSQESSIHGYIGMENLLFSFCMSDGRGGAIFSSFSLNTEISVLKTCGFVCCSINQADYGPHFGLFLTKNNIHQNLISVSFCGKNNTLSQGMDRLSEGNISCQDVNTSYNCAFGNGGFHSVSAITCSSRRITIVNNSVSHCRVLTSYNTSYSYFQNCNIVGNTQYTNEYGLVFANSNTDMILESCVFISNSYDLFSIANDNVKLTIKNSWIQNSYKSSSVSILNPLGATTSTILCSWYNNIQCFENALSKKALTCHIKGRFISMYLMMISWAIIASG